MPLHVSSSKCSSSGRPNCVNTSSGSHSPERVIPDDVLIQFGPPDEGHLCSKHVEAWNKYIKKECVKLVINQNYVKMHGQQNIKNQFPLAPDLWTQTFCVEAADYENTLDISASHFTICDCCNICKSCICSLATAWLLSPRLQQPNS
jgi:hypothetical protein